mgnify:CR=1 FL=1
MSTFIHLLSKDDELRRRNREQTQANRLRKVEKDEQREVGAQLQTIWAQQAKRDQEYGVLRPRSRKDEPAAWRENTTVKTGLAWLLLPTKDPSWFNATWHWSRSRYAVYTYPSNIIDSDDTILIKAGSGDKNTWAEARLSVTGFTEYERIRRETFLPFADDPVPGLYGTYLTSPVGKCYVATYDSEQYYDSSKIDYLCLPCGNGSAILVVYARIISSLCAWSRRCTSAYYAGQGLGWYVSGSEPVYLRNHNISTSGIVAFVVSHTDCRQINVPSGLESSLNDLLLSADLSGAQPWRITNNAYGIDLGPSAWNTPIPTNQYWFYHQDDYPYQGVGYWRRMFDNFVSNGNYVARSAFPYVMVSPAGDLISGFNLGVNCGDPTVFTIFSNPNALMASVDDFWTYDYPGLSKQQLLNIGCPAIDSIFAIDARDGGYQTIVSAIRNGSSGYTYQDNEDVTLNAIYNDPLNLLPAIKFVRLGSYPPGQDYPLSQSLPWLNAGSFQFSPYKQSHVDHYGINSYRLIFHNDWGKSTYCRQQLKLLGFTDADLTP